MLRSILLSAGGSLAFSLAMMLFLHTRTRESDAKGKPVLRYLAAPYLMLGCATAFLAVAIYQWFIPLNHHYSGNLLLLSYIPATIGLFALGMAIYSKSFQAVLDKTTIELYRWPLGHTTYNLSELEKIENGNKKVILHFRDNRKFIVYSSYSGHTHFLERLSNNKSFKLDALKRAP